MADHITAEADSGGTYGQPAGDRPVADDAEPARFHVGTVRLRSAPARRGGRRHFDSVGGGCGPGDGCGLPGNRICQPVMRGGSDVRRGSPDASRRAVAVGYRHGPRRRHVPLEMGVKVQVPSGRGTLFAMRAAQAFLRALLPLRMRGWTRSPPASGRPSRRPSSGRHWRRSGSRRKSTFSSVTHRGSSARTASPSKRWPWCFAGGLGMSSHWANSGEPS